ncbi:hypothetical protein Tco_1089157 [Tanacetum coccineum]
MSRENPQTAIVSKEQLVPSGNRLIIKKNNQGVASYSNITNTLLKLVVGILRHHKLYKPVSLTTTVPVIYLHRFWTTITHNSNIQLSTRHIKFHSISDYSELHCRCPHQYQQTIYQTSHRKQILAFIKILGYDEEQTAKMTYVSTFVATKLHQPWRAILSVLNRSLTGKDSRWDNARIPILQILWGIVQSANLDYTSLIWDEFKWQVVDKTLTESIRYLYTLIYSRSELDLLKLSLDHFLSLQQGQDSPLTKLINTVDSKYKFGIEIPESMIIDAIKQSTGYKFYKHKKEENAKGKAVEEPEGQHVSPIKSGKGKGYMRLGGQEVNVPSAFKKNVVPRKQRSITFADNLLETENEAKLKGPAIEDPTVQSLLDLRRGSKESRLESLSDETRDSSCSDTDEVKDDETDNSDMDLSDDEPKGDDAAAGFGVFMYDKSIKQLKSIYLSLTVTSSSSEYTRNLLNEPFINELMDFMSNPVYTDAHTTSVEENPKGNPEEMFLDEVSHHVSSPPENTTHTLVTNPQQNSL